ncbi:MAG: hypothetical protein N3G74_02580 [Candidatus Micrarchaeota archaeon]|nr:hypothetical protein [Candidatus Micrarchaeota archaeon]
MFKEVSQSNIGSDNRFEGKESNSWEELPFDESAVFSAVKSEKSVLTENEEKRKITPFWFVSHLGFEEYESKRNRLILTLRKWSLTDPNSITVYIEHPITISTDIFYSYESFREYLTKLDKKCSTIPGMNQKIICFISPAYREKKEQLEKEFSKFEFVIDNVKSFVVNATVPCEKRILDEFEKAGFQVKNINKQIRRQLEWMYKKVTVAGELEHLFMRMNELNDLNDSLVDFISSLYNKDPKSHDRSLAGKITRLSNEIRLFYLQGYRISDFGNSEVLRKKYPGFYKVSVENKSALSNIEEIGIKIGSMRFSLNTIAKSLDSRNSVEYNPDTKSFELVLHAKSDANPYIIGGSEPVGLYVSDERIPYVCWKSLSTCFLDIEKPMWKTEEERSVIQEIAELQAELANKNSTADPLKIRERIEELTKQMIVRTKRSGEVNILDERYKEQISRVMIHLRKEDGSVKKAYFKLRNSATDEMKEINGFVIFYFDTEYELLNAVIRFLKKEKPYRIVGHVIPYDLSEIRNSARENKAERFDLAVKKKEPRLWRRDFYQKVSMAAQEIIDTHRLAAVWYPYLKLKPFNLSHKLADVANFVFRLKRTMSVPTVMDSEFSKIATHDELKELEILAINGDKDAELRLDFYSTHDIDPLIEIFDFEPTLRLLYKAAAMVPHIPITDVAFTPTSMNEIFHLKEWKTRHAQLHYGYKQKKREDERQIFKKRLSEYMKRQLSDEGISQIKPGVYENVYITYIPLELFLSSTFFPSQPEWNYYFKTMSMNPIVKIAELQYPKYFMRQNIHVDYYLYRKEMDTLREMLRLLNLSRAEAEEIMKNYYNAVGTEDGTLSACNLTKRQIDKKSLLRQYYSAYETLKDKFRSFYISLKVKDKSASRKIKLHISKESTRREDNQLTFGFVNFFERENQDAIKLYGLPEDLEEKLEETSKEKLIKFRSHYCRLNKIRNDIVSILLQPKYSHIVEKVSPENVIFMFNQEKRAVHARDVFMALYHIPPEGPASFRALIDNAYKTIGDWIRNKNLVILGAKGDYIYVKEKSGDDIDFSDSPLIPIRKFSRINLGSDIEEETEFAFEQEFYD